MYAGTDKYGGGVVGANSNKNSSAGSSLEEIIETASAEETLVVQVPHYNDDGEEIGSIPALLSARLNPESGGLMWVQEEDEKETYNNVVSMSQMTSMLRDTDRNTKYEIGIKHAIQLFIERNNRAPNVLDIGTGTGLLSMLAAKHGANKVYACEMFASMAKIASEVTSLNFPNEKIVVISKRSTDIVINSIDGDMPQKADMLVSEIFDSVLLGEGVLPTITHAIDNLLVDNAIIVPDKAILYGQVIENEDLFRFHSFSNTFIDIDNDRDSRIHLGRSDLALSCSGSRIGIPFHPKSFPTALKNLSEYVEIFKFDFNKPFTADVKSLVKSITMTQNGSGHGLLLFWEVYFNDVNQTKYSTKEGVENWQDHWLPVFYPFNKVISVDKNSIAHLSAYHNHLNVWFDLEYPNHGARPEKQMKLADSMEKEPCICGMHLLCNSERIRMLTDNRRNTSFSNAIRTVIDSFVQNSAFLSNKLSCLDISDGSLCALIAAAQNRRTFVNTSGKEILVTSIESKDVSALMSHQLSSGNELAEWLDILECGCKGLLIDHMKAEAKVNLLIGEPFYYSMQNLPVWQALNFWYRRTAVNDILDDAVQVIPSKATIYGVGVEFENLSSCFGEVGQVNGFDHKPFDDCSKNWFDHNFPFPTYMYPYIERTKPFAVCDLEYFDVVHSITNSVEASFLSCDDSSSNPRIDAVIVYVTYDLLRNQNDAESIQVSTKNSLYSKQLVRFLPKPVELSELVISEKKLCANVEFKSFEGEINFNFSVE